MAIPPDRERGIPWSAGPPSQMPGGLPQALGQARGAPAPDGHGHPQLRMRLLQPRPNLSGEGAGDAVCGPRAFFELTGVPLGLGDQVPDAATPLKIRRRRLDRGCRVRRGAELRQKREGRERSGGPPGPEGAELALRLPGPCRRGRRKRPGAHGRGRRRQRQRRRHRLRPRAGGRPVLPRRLGMHGHGRLAPGCQRPRRHRAEHARKRPSGHVGGAHGREKAPRAALPVPLRAKTDRGKRSDRYEHH